MMYFFNLIWGHFFPIAFTEREREREASMWESNIIGCLSYAPQLGTEPATLACALTRDWTCSLSVYKTMLQPTEPHWPGLNDVFLKVRLDEAYIKFKQSTLRKKILISITKMYLEYNCFEGNLCLHKQCCTVCLEGWSRGREGRATPGPSCMNCVSTNPQLIWSQSYFWEKELVLSFSNLCSKIFTATIAITPTAPYPRELGDKSMFPLQIREVKHLAVYPTRSLLVIEQDVTLTLQNFSPIHFLLSYVSNKWIYLL